MPKSGLWKAMFKYDWKLFNIHNSFTLLLFASEFFQLTAIKWSAPRGQYIFTFNTMLIEPSQPGSNTFRNLSNEFEYLLIASSWTASMLDSFRHTLCVRHLRKDCVKPTRDTRKRSQVVRTPVRSSVYLLHVSIWGTFRNALNALQLKSFTMSSNRLRWVWLVGKFTII